MKTPGCCRLGKNGFQCFGKSPAASVSSVNSAAENYPNGCPTGNIPNGATDYIRQGWSRSAGIAADEIPGGEWRQQVMEERSPFFGGVCQLFRQ